MHSHLEIKITQMKENFALEVMEELEEAKRRDTSRRTTPLAPDPVPVSATVPVTDLVTSASLSDPVVDNTTSLAASISAPVHVPD